MTKAVHAVGIGLVLGVLTSFGQTYLPDPIKQFANSYSVWLLVSFVFGVYAGGRLNAIIGGGILQLAALIGYYVATQVRFWAGYGTPSILLFWVVGGVMGGPLFGVIGREYVQRGRRSIVALACLSVLILSEAAYLAVVLQYMIKSLCFVVLAAIVFVVGLLYLRYTTRQQAGFMQIPSKLSRD